jgi:hypothetical protein
MGHSAPRPVRGRTDRYHPESRYRLPRRSGKQSTARPGDGLRPRPLTETDL